MVNPQSDEALSKITFNDNLALYPDSLNPIFFNGLSLD